MKILKCLFVISLMVFPQASFADELEGVCLINAEDYSWQQLSKQVSEKGCEKGDMLIMGGGSNLFSLSGAVAQACDLERPFVQPASEVFICHYLGYLRKPR
jgi:hypothetical protein